MSARACKFPAKDGDGEIAAILETMEKPFKCDRGCGKSYGNKDALGKHQR